MTTENWINVAMIIAVIMTAGATILGPVLGSYVQARMSQPKPIPDTSVATPSSLIRRLIESKAYAVIAFVVDVLGFFVFVLLFIRLPLSKLTIGLFVFGSVNLLGHILSSMLLRLMRDVYINRLLATQHNNFLVHLVVTGQVKTPLSSSAEAKSEIQTRDQPTEEAK